MLWVAFLIAAVAYAAFGNNDRVSLDWFRSSVAMVLGGTGVILGGKLAHNKWGRFAGYK